MNSRPVVVLYVILIWIRCLFHWKFFFYSLGAFSSLSSAGRFFWPEVWYAFLLLDFCGYFGPFLFRFFFYLLYPLSIFIMIFFVLPDVGTKLKKKCSRVYHGFLSVSLYIVFRWKNFCSLFTLSDSG